MLSESIPRRQQLAVGDQPIEPNHWHFAGFAQRPDRLRNHLPQLLLAEGIGERPALFVLAENEELKRPRLRRPIETQRRGQPLAGPPGVGFRFAYVDLIDPDDHGGEVLVIGYW